MQPTNRRHWEVSPALPDIGTPNNEARKALEEIEAIRNPAQAAFLKAKANGKRARNSREELYPEHLGLDSRILTCALSWLR